jgi:hypothetical protein
MNSNRILNLAQPVDPNDAARLADVDAVVAAGLPDQAGHAGQALLTDGVSASWGAVETAGAAAAAMAAHLAAGDPHPTYLTAAEGNAAYDAIGAAAAAVAAHEGAGDPHPTYTTAAELASALGSYQPLDSDLSTLAANITTAGHNMAAAASTSAQWDLIKASSIQALVIACSDETSTLTTGTAKVTFRMPFAFTLTGIRASLTTAQTGGSLFTVDVNESGASILSTKITIDNNEKTSTTAATPPVITDSSLADDAEMTIDIDTVGSGTPTGLKVTLIGYKT